MLFNSYIFIFLFLPLTFGLYFLINHTKHYNLGKIVLVIASLIFYAYYNISYLAIIVTSIIVNYAFNKLLRIAPKKSILCLAMIVNIGVLVYFKYFNFLLYNINLITHQSFSFFDIVMPLGISFFTFQQISYIVDTYKGQVPDYRFFDYALFVSFFPQLIAGPIVSHDEMVPQFQSTENKKINFENVAMGIEAFSIGLAKKVLVADTFGKIVDYGYANLTGLNTLLTLLVIFGYTMQIYFDFSGYCDMATGIGLLFNIHLPQNFNSPYKATDINDFWKRWHMTLTRFLTKYIYIPLGGNRKGKGRTYLNILIVFFISGLWHGAGYTFILWGMLHGVAQCLTRMLKKPIEKIPKFIMWAVTFVFLNVTWVFFRAGSISDALTLFSGLFHGGFTIAEELSVTLLTPAIMKVFSRFLSLLPLVLVGCFIALAVCMFSKNTNEIIGKFKPTVPHFVYSLILFLLSVVSLSGVSTFLYFNF